MLETGLEAEGTMLRAGTGGAHRAAAAAPQGDTFSIGDLKREFGVTARTLRFYEEKGLLNPQRAGQERVFSRRDRARLHYVIMGRQVGFALDEIRDMLDLYDLGERRPAKLTAALEAFRERIGRLERQRADVDRALAELKHAGRMIEGMLAREHARASTGAG